MSPDGLQPTRRRVLCSAQASPGSVGRTSPQNTLGKFPWKAPVLCAGSTCNPAAAGGPQPLSLPSQPRGLHAQPLLAPIPAALPHPMHTQMAAASPRCSPLYPKNLLHAGGEPLRQPLAAQGSSRGAEPLLRELVPGMPRLPGRAALHHLAAAAQRDHEHHAGAVRQRAGRSRRGPVPCPCRWCCRPRSDRFVPQEKKVGGKWQFQCQHGSEECLGNMIQVSRAVPVLIPVLRAPGGGPSPLSPVPAGLPDA